LARILSEGAERGRLAFDPETNRAAWLDWHARLPLPIQSRDRQGAEEALPLLDGRGSERPKAERRPLVSVCMPHHNLPHLLAQALESLRQQDYPNLEVVLVDDASTDADAHAYLDQLAPEFARRGWQLARLPANRYAAGARNAAARLARGDYLLFMDDDNVAKPHEVSTLVDVAQRTGADLVGCFVDIVEGQTLPGPDTAVSRYAFLGPALALGLWRNALGDTNSLMRREVFVALGGFTEDYGVSNEDHEFMVRAVLRGFCLEMIPEALFWYRRTPNSVNHSADPVANILRALRPYLEAVPPELRPALQLAQGLMGQEIAPEKWRSRPVRYRAVDWLVAALERQPRVFALARSLVQWSVRLWKRSRPFSSQPVNPSPRRSEPNSRAA
jgi:O-antigen biosynthesis protein